MKILKAKIKKSLYGYKVYTYIDNCDNFDKKSNFVDLDGERDYEQESVNRAKRQAIDYGINNIWDYFITITFDIKKINRYDYELCLKKVKKAFNNYKFNQSSNFKYLIIPELHELKIGEEKAAIHFHGLVSGIRECDVKFIKNSKKYHNSVYSFLPMYNRFGTTNLIPIKNQTENVTYYICKYICKAGRLLKKSFYASNGLKTSEEVLNSDSNNMLIPNLNTLISNGFSPSYCSSFCTIYDIPAELIPILDNTIDIVEDISKYVQQYKLTGDINEFTQFQKQLE